MTSGINASPVWRGSGCCESGCGLLALYWQFVRQPGRLILPWQTVACYFLDVKSRPSGLAIHDKPVRDSLYLYTIVILKSEDIIQGNRNLGYWFSTISLSC